MFVCYRLSYMQFNANCKWHPPYLVFHHTHDTGVFCNVTQTLYRGCCLSPGCRSSEDQTQTCTINPHNTVNVFAILHSNARLKPGTAAFQTQLHLELSCCQPTLDHHAHQVLHMCPVLSRHNLKAADPMQVSCPFPTQSKSC